MILTVFTPTYNRASYLERIYNSLLQQEFSDFEWLIIDDGSTDNTKEVVSSLQSNNHRFLINYYYKENGGKHTAINFSANVSKGDFILWLDSDDIVLPYSIDELVPYLKSAKMNSDISAVVALRLDDNGAPLCDFIPDSPIDVTFRKFILENNVNGEYAWSFKTNILKQYPYPVFPNEKFCTEIVVINRISEKYKTRYIPISVEKGGYQSDGLTSNIRNIKRRNPLGFMTLYKEGALSKQTPLKCKIKYSILYWVYYIRCKSDIPDELKPTLVLNIFKIPSYFIYYITKVRKYLQNDKSWY